MGNRIPRKFDRIIGEMLVKTNCGKIGDTIHVCKNEFNEYIGENIRTGERYNFPVSTLRIKEVFKIINIEI